jgi:hypothetical protein
MKAAPESTRWRITLWGMGLGVFIVLAAMQWHQARQTRFLEPAGVASTTNAYATWTAAPEQVATATKRQNFCDPFLMLGPMNSGMPATGTAILYNLPYTSDGYMLNIGVTRADNQHPPLLTISVNDVLLRGIQIPLARLGETNPFHSEELLIPGKLLHPGRENRLAVRNARGLHWLGHLALIPDPQWRRLLPLLVPLSGWCVLASALFLIASPRGQRRFPVLLLVVLFVIYYQSSYIRDMAPVTGFFFSDAPDFIDPICHKIFNLDMNKHPLFLPVIRFWVKPFHFVRLGEIASLSAAFALIGTLNGLMAFLWFRRWLGEFRTAGALTLLYAFSLAIWAYSSNYETYAFSSLMGNLFFWVLLRAKRPDRSLSLLLPSLAIGFAALAHPPLLILFVPLVIHRTFQRLHAFPWIGMVAASLVVVAVFLAGQILIRHYYMQSTDLPDSLENDLHSASDPVSREISNIRSLYHRYAQAQSPVPVQLGTVLTSQFVYSLAGLPYPFDWSRGIDGLRDYFRSVTGPPALGAILCLWLGALLGLLSSRRFLGNSLILLAGIMAPWLTFFILFNPSEMLLYSAPMIAPILAWLGGANRLVFKQHTAGFLLTISLILTIHNAWVLASYY